MTNVMALTTDGGDTGLKAEALEGLAGRLRGQVLTPRPTGTRRPGKSGTA